jgi:phosphonoacetaldehyde hydrolase
MKNCNSTCLNGQPLQADLQALLGQPLALANDANCLALSEATDGAGAGAAVVFAAILGTGAGAGIAVHGRVLSGPNGLAGEWGHNPLPLMDEHDWPRPDCYCGRAGCVETWLSGPALAADHLRTTGQALSAQAVAASAATGDARCVDTLERYCGRAARALAGVINLLDPDVIVLGGGLSNIDRLYEQYLPLNAHTVTEHAELVPGTVEVVQWLRSRGVSVGSNTGYGRELITPLLPLAAAQGFEPDCVICADDVPFSRPSPMALYRAFIELGTWPARRVVKVDDTVPGLLEGRHAGCWTVGVLSSGNEVGLSLAQWQALSADERAVRLQRARVRLSSCDPDYLIPSVADLPGVIEMIERRLIAGDRPKVD